MQTYLNILEELKEETEKTKTRSWKWLLFWQKHDQKAASKPTDDPEEEALLEQNGLNPPELPPNKHPQLIMERHGSVWNSLGEANVQQGLYCKMLSVARVLERDDGWLKTLHVFHCC